MLLVSLGLQAVGQERDSTYYPPLPITIKGMKIRAATFSDATGRSMPFGGVAFHVEQNNIAVDDTLQMIVTPEEGVNPRSITVELKFCDGPCGINEQAGQTKTNGYTVFSAKLSELKNNTAKFLIKEQAPVVSEQGDTTYFDNTNVKEMYVYVKSNNRSPVQVDLQVSLKKKKINNLGIQSPTLYKPDLKTAKYHALLIGVTNYRDPALRLKGPDIDITKLSGVLGSQYEFSTITTMIDPTRKELRDSLMALAYTLFKDDNLLIYFAGHGIQSPSKEGYWALQDAKDGDLTTFLSNDDLVSLLRPLRVQHLLVIVDACFGSNLMVRRGFTDQSTEARTWEEVYNQKSRQVFSSSHQAEVPDSSIFINYLTKRLRDNTEDYITGSELYESLKYPVHNNTPNRQRPRFGEIEGLPPYYGEFLFKRRKPDSPEPLRLVSRPDRNRNKTDSDTLEVDYVTVVDLNEPDPHPTRGAHASLIDAGAVIYNAYSQPIQFRISSPTGKKLESYTLPSRKSLASKFSGPVAILEILNSSFAGQKLEVVKGRMHRIQFKPSTQSFDLEY
ncbi:caspase family protein [Larkinella sp. VNQ87]|uniref:caspase family protein n=1 Tax=Larkinella sp. VNQ87 TaxID=3400921 RepID=UPI003C04F1CD